jgi:hypothetical protein
MQRFPDNPTCSASPRPIEDESASSIECRDRYETSADRDCRSTHGVSGPTMFEPPDGLEDPIEIQLGLGYWDAAWL